MANKIGYYSNNKSKCEDIRKKTFDNLKRFGKNINLKKYENLFNKFMKIFLIRKIFIHQKYGGPSRYFVNLVNELNSMNSINAKFLLLFLNNFLSSIDKLNIGFANKILFNNKISNSPKLKKLMSINDYMNVFLFKNFNTDILHTTYYDFNKIIR